MAKRLPRRYRRHDWEYLKEQWANFPVGESLKRFCTVHDIPYNMATKKLKAVQRMGRRRARAEQTLFGKVELILDQMILKLQDGTMSQGTMGTLLPKLLDRVEAYREKGKDGTQREVVGVAMETLAGVVGAACEKPGPCGLCGCEHARTDIARAISAGARKISEKGRKPAEKAAEEEVKVLEKTLIETQPETEEVET